ncbi:hypothetical protein [Cuneatibacter caecimuris]|uniref:Cytoskeletal protein CcmA (Bactofilin family) n=1 Tax=Cuneatibacter caecimuris TaxID=1796618 RepID=A0A4V2F7S9_9FIRM|nr:hypothetical protein [Cuneatibacter caecimuris]RZT00889.1 hypothetical protein EV209_1325 [Cuneatibacter caecimuris]
MERKYEFTGETTEIDFQKLHRIVAVRDFGVVSAGDLGGWIKDENNLSHDGTAWVADEAAIYEDALVEDDAFAMGRVRVRGSAHVGGEAQLSENSCVEGDTYIRGKAQVYGCAHVHGSTLVEGKAKVLGYADIAQSAHIDGNALVSGNAEIRGNSHVTGTVKLHGDASVCGNALIRSDEDWITVTGFGSGGMCATFFHGSDDKIYVQYDGFYGTIDRFREKIKGTKYEGTFMPAIKAACIHFNSFSHDCENESEIIVEESDEFVSSFGKYRGLLLFEPIDINVNRENGTKYWMDKDMADYRFGYVMAVEKLKEEFKDSCVLEAVLTPHSYYGGNLRNPLNFRLRCVREDGIVRVYPM